MLKYMYQKNKHLIRITCIIVLAVFVYGTLLIVDAIQKAERESRTGEAVIIQENTGDIPAYNVDGLTDEQIMEFLEMERDKRRSE